MDKQLISKKLNLNPDNIFNIYRYGSIIYNTNTKDSDEDFIIIQKQKEFKIDSINSDDNTINATLYSLSGFKDKMFYQEISVLECLWIPENMKIEKFPLSNFYKYRKIELRKSISKTASNSWCKCKKKLWQGDIEIGQKSAFHSLRIFDFGIQIAEYGKIIDYHKNFKKLLNDIKKFDDWKNLKNKYQKEFNKLHSKFKKLTS